MARNWIVRGDPTSSGGTVISGSPFTDIDGIAVARITDQATCPAHKGVFPIVDGDATLVVDGQPVALHGSSLACGCKVLSAQQMHVAVDAGASAGSVGGLSSGLGLLRQADDATATSAAWTQKDVLRVLCPKDNDIVEELAGVNLEVADEVYFDDPYFDGTNWTTKRFVAGGFQDETNNRIVLLSGGSAQDAATTLYHEVRHKTQPNDLSWRDRELDAYTVTEAWTIERGLPGQGGLRMQDHDGQWRPDADAIRALVDREYPIVSDAPGGPIVVGRNSRGETVMSDGTSRLPRKGDTYPAEQETMVGVRKIPAEEWKCPGSRPASGG